MGCKQSTPKGEEKPKPQAAPAPQAPKKQEPAEIFLRTFFVEAIKFLSELKEPEELKLAQMVVFLNSVAEVVRQSFRMKLNPAIELMRSIIKGDGAAEVALKVIDDVEDHVMDDGYVRLLNAWAAHNPNHEKKMSSQGCMSTLRTLEIHLSQATEGDFYHLLTLFTDVTTSNKAIHDLFAKYCSNGQIMTLEEYLTFMREAQCQENATERAALDKIRNRFGGKVTKYNFCGYHSGLITNSAFDPQRATNVWQDMTQPLPHYMISTAQITSEKTLNRAMREGVRSFVLQCARDENGKACTGTCPLQLVLDQVKSLGFRDNAYPIIICFDPNVDLEISLQDEIAEMVKKTLGQMVARGIMFEGAIISDPNFSPAALQKKVLLLGRQAPLKPFVGFHVADMNRDGLGVRVTDVKGSTPASKAGIAKDDWLTHINGLQIQNKRHLREQLATFHLGDEFTMKKENLDEVRIVVGGAVTASDGVAAQSLSDIIFLKFCNDSERNATHFPWDTIAVEGSALSHSPVKRRELSDHFLFVLTSGGEPPASPTSGADFVGEATAKGAQFVDTGNTAPSHIWARGLFAENAHCGYILKGDLENEVSCNVVLQVIAPPSCIRNAALAETRCRVHGPAHASHQGDSTFHFDECDEATVVVVELVYKLGDETHTFIASFPPLLLRSGFRMLPVLREHDELAQNPATHCVLCWIQTQRDFTGTVVSTSTS